MEINFNLTNTIMKKVLSFLFVAAVAAFVLVSCSKPKTPAKQDKDSKEQDSGKEDGGNQDEEEVKLAVDGKFGEWKDIDPVGGDDAILLMKTQMNDQKIYFYIEADVNSLYVDDCSYANYLSIYIDCGEESTPITYWGGEEGCTYDVLFQVWLMQKAKANMANWDTGFSGRAKIEDGVYKGEFCWTRATDALKSKVLYFGASLTDQYVEYPEDGATEGAWMPGDDIGLAPSKGEDMARIK